MTIVFKTRISISEYPEDYRDSRPTTYQTESGTTPPLSRVIRGREMQVKQGTEELI